jgi:hypothetical protein
MQGGKKASDDLLLLLQVDVLVSEWMGYALLFETMLDSVSGGGRRGVGEGALNTYWIQMWATSSGDALCMFPLFFFL